MSSTLSEISKHDGIMTQKQCNHVKYFKDFLRELTNDAVTNKGSIEADSEGVNISCNGCSGGVELRPFILTRSNNESYEVRNHEQSAEIILCVWQWLIQKQCPDHFRLGVLLSAVDEIRCEIRKKKIQEELKAAVVKHSEEASEDVILDLFKLQKHIHQRLEKFLLLFSDNSKEDNLKNFADCSRKHSFNCDFPSSRECRKFVVAHVKNKPRKMEDRHICLPQFSELYQIENSLSFYGVFDGHSGSLSATYAATHIPHLAAQQIKSLYNSCSVDNDVYRDALEATFMQVDANFCRKQLSSGTTAVCALLIKDDIQNFKHLYVAWVGDSRCLLVSPTVHLQLVKPHKPDSIDEKKRIESAETGGSVLYVQGQWRVNGIINVSRSIGDYTVKAVIAEPDIVDVPLQPSHDFLVLGSDGLWDHVGEIEIVDCIYKFIIDDNQCLDDIPKHLIELAKQGDSQDNITVVIVLLKERQQIKEYFLKGLTKLS